MFDDPDSLVEVDADGVARPLGETALLRLQARSGVLQVLPSPPELLVLRCGPANEGRACLLSGEVRSPGALCDVVSFVAHAGWRGEFLVVDASSMRSIDFDQGFVIGAQSTVATERLGQVLERCGILTEEQVRVCADASAGGAIRFGEAAVKHGFVTREALFNAMAKQIEEIFYGMLRVGGGMFYFLDAFDEESLAVRQQLAVSNLIREGVRRMHETRYFRARIPSDAHVPARIPGRAPPEGEGADVYAAVDGARSVADLCRVLKRTEFEVSRALFQLVQSGCVGIKPPRLSVGAIVDTYNRAVALILRELDAMDEGDAVREQLSGFIASSDVLRRVLANAAPADDGTLDAARVAQNLAGLGAIGNPEEALAQALHELASYALFLARPHLRRAQGRTDGDPRRRLSVRVAEMLDPIAVAAGADAPRRGER